MSVRKHRVTLRTATGTGTVYSPYVSGKLAAIHYTKHGSNAYSDGVVVTTTAEATGETLWTEVAVNASKSCYPRAGTHSTAGVASVYVGSGTAVNDIIRLARDRVKIVLSSAGTAKDGTFDIVMED